MESMSTVIVEQNVPARMRDGVTLNADVYRPAAPGRYPVLLTRLPYGKDLMLANLFPVLHFLRAVRAGYVVIAQDCRGTFASEGQFDSCFHEGQDGYDAIEWAAALPYASGAVGMFGPSYLGWTQWSAAGLLPPHLKAIAPMQTWSDYSGMRFRGGAFELGDTLQWLSRMSMARLARELAGQGKPAPAIAQTVRTIVRFLDSLTEDGYRAVPLRHLSALEPVGLASIIGGLLGRAPGRQQPGFRIDYTQVEVPSLNISGWYDVFQQYALDNFVGARTQGRGAARQAHLLVGPWTHGMVMAAPGMMVGEVNFGTAASGATLDLKGDLTDIHLRWFDRWLKGVDNGVDREPAVRLFVTGENRWAEMTDWPPKEATDRRLYLRADSKLAFAAPRARGGSTSFTYDPADPAPTLGGNIVLARPGVRDQRPLSERPDVLSFVGGPLDKPLAVMGRIIADLFVSSSAPDTDFVARLIDVHPDGYMRNLCDGILRARYRNSLEEPEWLTPGEVYRLKVDMWSIAHVFGVGHRLAVQVTGSSFPRWDRNWNSKDEPGAGTGGPPARQTVWHDAGHPSAVVLPVTK